MRALVFGFTLMVLLGTSLFQLIGSITWMKPAYASNDLPYQTVIVQSGDSLWKLADRYNEEHQLTVHEMVGILASENRISNGMIYPGQVIHIPHPVQK
ncbi:LysM peptidoglycan-binding domain-containing protein [Ammoniphilus sp. YIM 78166]|uniref:cell division suppressor protein YneA n=1 Tax=Ammoniphilus sp. YIM 78166 TaxID=1644106 RepID=UPI00106F77D5|nr:LysM peptidoglycan-binding domain-containing protein [Ammoniphilus sp. YIM 78166]